MADILLQCERIAITARVIAPIKNVVIAMSTAQPAQSAVSKAAAQNKWLFAVYMVLLLVVAFVSWLLWRSGNNLQDAIRDEARKDIAALNAVAETAKKDAAEANDRAENLEHDNLTLSGEVAGLQKAASDALAEQQRVQTQLEEQQGKTAALERAATDAKAAQQTIQTDLARQQERAAKAERSLLELQKRLKDRHFDVKARAIFLETLKAYPIGKIQIGYTESDAEGESFAKEILFLLLDAKWDVELGGFLRPNVGKGITIGVKDASRPPARAVGLARALAAAGFNSKFHSWGYEDEDLIWLDVGARL
jgi:hypothetical protein